MRVCRLLFLTLIVDYSYSYYLVCYLVLALTLIVDYSYSYYVVLTLTLI